MGLLVRKYKLLFLDILRIFYLISVVGIKITKIKIVHFKLYYKNCFSLTKSFGFIVVLLCRWLKNFLIYIMLLFALI